jgi:hypothetical protein
MNSVTIPTSSLTSIYLYQLQKCIIFLCKIRTTQKNIQKVILKMEAKYVQGSFTTV